jgi:hypothetical protein
MVEIAALVGDTARGLAYAATRVARHPPHLSWPAWLREIFGMELADRRR